MCKFVLLCLVAVQLVGFSHAAPISADLLNAMIDDLKQLKRSSSIIADESMKTPENITPRCMRSALGCFVKEMHSLNEYLKYFHKDMANIVEHFITNAVGLMERQDVSSSAHGDDIEYAKSQCQQCNYLYRMKMAPEFLDDLDSTLRFINSNSDS